MNQGIGAITSIFGMLLSALGMGSSTYQQVNMMRSPSAYATPAAQPGQSCWLDRAGTMAPGSFAVVEHADGSKTLECVVTAQR
jgi:hypothetical protein